MAREGILQSGFGAGKAALLRMLPYSPGMIVSTSLYVGQVYALATTTLLDELMISFFVCVVLPQP